MENLGRVFLHSEPFLGTVGGALLLVVCTFVGCLRFCWCFCAFVGFVPLLDVWAFSCIVVYLVLWTVLYWVCARFFFVFFCNV